MQPQRHVPEHVGLGEERECSDGGGAGAAGRVGDDGVEVPGAGGGREWECGVGLCVWVQSGGVAFDLSG